MMFSGDNRWIDFFPVITYMLFFCKNKTVFIRNYDRLPHDFSSTAKENKDKLLQPAIVNILFVSE
jgi:hypothetical protein